MPHGAALHSPLQPSSALSTWRAGDGGGSCQTHAVSPSLLHGLGMPLPAIHSSLLPPCSGFVPRTHYYIWCQLTPPPTLPLLPFLCISHLPHIPASCLQAGRAGRTRWWRRALPSLRRAAHKSGTSSRMPPGWPFAATRMAYLPPARANTGALLAAPHLPALWNIRDIVSTLAEK